MRRKPIEESVIAELVVTTQHYSTPRACVVTERSGVLSGHICRDLVHRHAAELCGDKAAGDSERISPLRFAAGRTGPAAILRALLRGPSLQAGAPGISHASNRIFSVWISCR